VEVVDVVPLLEPLRSELHARDKRKYVAILALTFRRNRGPQPHSYLVAGRRYIATEGSVASLNASIATGERLRLPSGQECRQLFLTPDQGGALIGKVVLTRSPQ
jgi:hypothetical protein